MSCCGNSVEPDAGNSEIHEKSGAPTEQSTAGNVPMKYSEAVQANPGAKH